MEVIFDTGNPVLVFIYTIISVCVIILGKKTKKQVLPGMITIFYLFLLLYHAVKIGNTDASEIEILSRTYTSIIYDILLLLINYISFLWIEDIAIKNKNQNEKEDKLSWFWNKF